MHAWAVNSRFTTIIDWYRRHSGSLKDHDPIVAILAKAQKMPLPGLSLRIHVRWWIKTLDGENFFLNQMLGAMHTSTVV